MSRAKTLLILFFCFLLTLPAVAGQIYYLTASGTVDNTMYRYISRGIAAAEEEGAEAVLVEIDTFGGLVDSAVNIRDAILESRVPVITFVKQRAWSAGALISLAGNRLVMAPGSSIGAAETRPNEEKYISAFRKEFQATAETRGKDPQIAAAMVDADISIPDIIEAGKLLTLTAKEAYELRIADAIAGTREAAAHAAGYQGKLIPVKKTLSDTVLGWITHPVISGFLLAMGFSGLVLEILTAGWGGFGSLGLISLGLFFAGHYYSGSASLNLIPMFAVGLVLLLLEFFVVPGFGLTGIGGIALILLSVFLAFNNFSAGLAAVSVALLVSVILILIGFKKLPKSRLWTKLSLGTSLSTEAGYVSRTTKADMVGKAGEAITALRPSGAALIEGERVDVVSEGGWIEPKTKIIVTKIEGPRIVVREYTEPVE
ncbi:MAG: nodulation protein NfeD [Firmicutes bacterium]|nr:nodulation protein NfeD [Bacillota bacterium]